MTLHYYTKHLLQVKFDSFFLSLRGLFFPYFCRFLWTLWSKIKLAISKINVE